MIAYERSGTLVEPEARYGVHLFDEQDVRASRPLMAGSSSLLAGAENTTTWACRWTRGTIGDLDDPRFAKSSNRRFAVGQALAPGYPDVALAGALRLPKR